MASGEGSTSLANQFRVGRTTVPVIIDETVRAINKVLSKRVLKMPTRDNFLNISEGFWKRWNFPHCIGAIDGKHIAIIVSFVLQINKQTLSTLDQSFDTAL